MKRSLRGILAAWLAVMCALFACGCAGEDKTVTVTFRAVGEEDIVLTVDYGGSVVAPEVPEKIGNEGRWDTDTLQNLTQDTVVTAVYETQGLNFQLRNGNSGADREELYYVVDKGNMDLETEELFIPSEYNGFPVKEVYYKGFSGLFRLRYAEFSEGLIKIGDNAFAQCVLLERVVFPESLREIGSEAFYFCYQLKEFTFPEQLQTIGKDAFLRNHAEEIVLPGAVTEPGEGCFAGARFLIKAVIEKGITCLPERMFNFCVSLCSIELPPDLTGIGAYAFGSNQMMQTITIPAGVVEMGENAFYDWKPRQTIIVEGYSEQPEHWPDGWSGNATVIWNG